MLLIFILIRRSSGKKLIIPLQFGKMFLLLLIFLYLIVILTPLLVVCLIGCTILLKTLVILGIGLLAYNSMFLPPIMVRKPFDDMSTIEYLLEKDNRKTIGRVQSRPSRAKRCSWCDGRMYIRYGTWICPRCDY